MSAGGRANAEVYAHDSDGKLPRSVLSHDEGGSQEGGCKEEEK